MRTGGSASKSAASMFSPWASTSKFSSVGSATSPAFLRTEKSCTGAGKDTTSDLTRFLLGKVCEDCVPAVAVGTPRFLSRVAELCTSSLHSAPKARSARSCITAEMVSVFESRQKHTRLPSFPRTHSRYLSSRRIASCRLPQSSTNAEVHMTTVLCATGDLSPVRLMCKSETRHHYPTLRGLLSLSDWPTRYWPTFRSSPEAHWDLQASERSSMFPRRRVRGHL
jgi:hypothetical protein